MSFPKAEFPVLSLVPAQRSAERARAAISLLHAHIQYPCAGFRLQRTTAWNKWWANDSSFKPAQTSESEPTLTII